VFPEPMKIADHRRFLVRHSPIDKFPFQANPDFSRTALRFVSEASRYPRSRMVGFRKKFAWEGLTRAPPKRFPLKSHSSISCQPKPRARDLEHAAGEGTSYWPACLRRVMAPPCAAHASDDWFVGAEESDSKMILSFFL
jgi:hypothetical protein